MRLFVALELPEDVAEELEAMGSGIPGARWVPPENMHLTLSFIGEADGAAFDEIGAALAEVRGRPFDLQLAGIGHFETRRQPRALWVGVLRNELLMRLQASVETALRRAGIEPEARKYKPHVTLARLKEAADARLETFIRQHSLYQSRSFTVAQFVLFSSFLSRSGAIYRAEAEFPLEG